MNAVLSHSPAVWHEDQDGKRWPLAALVALLLEAGLLVAVAWWSSRPAPPPPPQPRPGDPNDPASWERLAQCESGGNPTIVSANGLYYGLYQFSLGTWAAVGGSGLPSQASPAEQTMRAQILQARAGWGQWPACAAKLGLL